MHRIQCPQPSRCCLHNIEQVCNRQLIRNRIITLNSHTTHNNQCHMSHLQIRTCHISNHIAIIHRRAHSLVEMTHGRRKAWGLLEMNDFPPHSYGGTYPPDGIGEGEGEDEGVHRGGQPVGNTHNEDNPNYTPPGTWHL